MEFYIQLCGALHQTRWDSYFVKNWFVPALEVNFSKKLPQLVAFLIFQSSYSVMGNHWTIIFNHIIII